MQLRGLRIQKLSAGAEENRIACPLTLKFCVNLAVVLIRAGVWRMRHLIFLIITGICSFAQADSSSYPYLLRLEHDNSEDRLCVLLQTSGAFHLEMEQGDSTRIFEGTVGTKELEHLERDLDHDALTALSQQQIEEPLMRSRDMLQINVFRTDHWQGLLFQSRESQEPFQQSVQPLIRWLHNLHKLPHQEFSEDAARNNCLPPKTIALKKRAGARLAGSSQPSPIIASRIVANQSLRPEPPQLSRHESVPVLLHLFSSNKNAEGAHQYCVIIAENGDYRFENRTQKNGSKQVRTDVYRSRITADELQDLQHLLADPTLAEIGHHEPRGNSPVPVMGDMLDISIARANGVQKIILSSGFNRRQMGFFYGGDADLSVARPLLKFLSDHVERNKSGISDPALRNDCQAP